MWLHELQIRNFRSIVAADLAFSRSINVIVGRNNAGKSSILLPIMALQEQLPVPTPEDRRHTATDSNIHFRLALSRPS
jgi:recombinational DNA repair ATPase RecF